MKATDLMIGDWVYGKKAPELPFVVTGVARNIFITNGKFINGKCVDGSSAGPFVEEEIKPIPLTKEILIKNGWCEESDYENDLYGGHFPEDKEHRLELDIDGSEVWWTINCRENYIIPLHYVHDLQHALKLCGIEKEIKL